MGQQSVAERHVDAPETSTAAILKDSAPVPDGIPRVSGIDFDDYEGRDVSVVELLAGMENMGFQASESIQ